MPTSDKTIDRNKDYHKMSLAIGNGVPFILPNKPATRQTGLDLSLMVSIRKLIPYYRIWKYLESLGEVKPIDLDEVKRKAVSYVKKRRSILEKNLEGIESEKELSRMKERINEELKSETRVLIHNIMHEKKDLARIVSENFGVKIGVTTINLIKKLGKGTKEETIKDGAKKGEKIPAKTGKELLAHHSVSAYEFRETHLSSKVVFRLQNQFREFYQKYILCYLPACDKVEIIEGIPTFFVKVPLMTIDKETGKEIRVMTETKEKKVKVEYPISFGTRAVVSHFGKLYPSEPEEESKFSFKGSVPFANQFKEIKGKYKAIDEQGNEVITTLTERKRTGQIALPVSLAHVSDSTFQWVWERDVPTVDNPSPKLMLVRKQLHGELLTLNQPIAYETREEIETVTEEKSTHIPIYRDTQLRASLKVGKKKIHASEYAQALIDGSINSKDSITVENAGKYTTGEIVIYISSLFSRSEQDIPEDKSTFFSRDGKTFRSFNKFQPRFGLFDVINDVVLTLWGEILLKAQNKEKQFSEEELKSRCFTLARDAFKTRLLDAKRLDSLTVGIEESDFQVLEERGHALAFAGTESINRAFPSLHEEGISEDTLEFNSLPVGEARKTIRERYRKQYADIGEAFAEQTQRRANNKIQKHEGNE